MALGTGLSQVEFANENMRHRRKAGARKGAARGQVGGATAGRGNRAKFVTDSFKLLDKITAETAFPKRLEDLHIKVTVRTIVMKEEATFPHGSSVQVDRPFSTALAAL